MDLQEKYDELANIVVTLDVLIDEISDKYYIDMLNEIKFEAQDQRNEIQEELIKQEEKEMFEQNRDFEKNRL